MAYSVLRSAVSIILVWRSLQSWSDKSSVITTVTSKLGCKLLGSQKVRSNCQRWSKFILDLPKAQVWAVGLELWACFRTESASTTSLSPNEKESRYITAPESNEALSSFHSNDSIFSLCWLPAPGIGTTIDAAVFDWDGAHSDPYKCL